MDEVVTACVDSEIGIIDAAAKSTDVQFDALSTQMDGCDETIYYERASRDSSVSKSVPKTKRVGEKEAERVRPNLMLDDHLKSVPDGVAAENGQEPRLSKVDTKRKMHEQKDCTAETFSVPVETISACVDAVEAMAIGLSAHVGALEEPTSAHVDAMEIRLGPTKPDRAAAWINTYGTLNCGAETMRAVWPGLEHRFAVRCENEPDVLPNDDTHGLHGPRVRRDLLETHPVDMVVMERGHVLRSRKCPEPEEWELLVSSTPASDRPKVIVESWRSQASTWDNGPSAKAATTRWTKLGYTSRYC
jgi:hypothetical protein